MKEQFNLFDLPKHTVFYLIQGFTVESNIVYVSFTLKDNHFARYIFQPPKKDAKDSKKPAKSAKPAGAGGGKAKKKASFFSA